MDQSSGDSPSPMVKEGLPRERRDLWRLGGYGVGNKTEKSYEVGEDPGCKRWLVDSQRSFECVEEIRAQRVVHGNSQVTENSPTFARMVRKSAEIMKDKETSMEIEDTNKQVESNQEPSEINHDNNRVVLQNPITEIVNGEIDEAEPIMSQQQFIMQGKEKETSNWVQQNLIKSGKIFGVDFQGNEKDAIELLLQIDSCRLARRQEQCNEIKKSKTKGVQEKV
ncbi:hypothetical protein MTR67_035575 [Solanum verrucosum]|uniref:Uncharacterized protein n=1 Tax=Solanum verrucosum TaxID=315347 RepID=A0AAF0UA01_SOLVR|nr:hypothetical protein MTR67_035575 [Solanum verrucosum]